MTAQPLSSSSSLIRLVALRTISIALPAAAAAVNSCAHHFPHSQLRNYLEKAFKKAETAPFLITFPLGSFFSCCLASLWCQSHEQISLSVIHFFPLNSQLSCCSMATTLEGIYEFRIRLQTQTNDELKSFFFLENIPRLIIVDSFSDHHHSLLFNYPIQTGDSRDDPVVQGTHGHELRRGNRKKTNDERCNSKFNLIHAHNPQR